jgi:hypothetical protein
MTSTEKIAIAAHLHVLLRRKTGRVTDTEWMASNPDYAGEVIRLAREKVAEGGHDDLRLLADRLEWVMGGPDPLSSRQLVKRMSDAAKEHSSRTQANKAAASAGEAGGNAFGDSQMGVDGMQRPAPPDTPRYVKGLR